MEQQSYPKMYMSTSATRSARLVCWPRDSADLGGTGRFKRQQQMLRQPNVFPVCCARPTCRASDAARPLPRPRTYPEGAICSGRDAVASADSRGAKRRVGHGRVPAPLES